MTFSAMRLLISREVERVATRKSLVFILRIRPDIVQRVYNIRRAARLSSPFCPARDFLLSLFLVGQTKTILEERVVVHVAYVDGNLHHRPRPRAGKFSSWPVIAEQDIADSLPFCSRQPGCDESVALRQRLGDNERTT